MKRRVLGRTGMSVSDHALGAMMFGAWANTDHEESIRMIHAALDAGINFVDTADVYSDGESEEILGRALKNRRKDVVLSTKFALPMGPDANHSGGSRRWIIRATEDSLRRLDTEYIDLYFMHRYDPTTALDDTLSALSDLIRSGKVRAVGSSLFTAEQTLEAQWIAERRGHERFRSEQSPYSILLRGIESEVLPAVQRHGMGMLTFGPLSSGWLSGRDDPTAGNRARRAPGVFDLSDPGNQAKVKAVDQLKALAADAGMPLTHLATAFVKSHPAVTSVLIGPRRPEQLQDLLAGADVELSADVLDRIDEIVPPGMNLNDNDIYNVPSALADKRLRRR
jgi:aryl-alcohol dehydrogenase-like predicted oxidoreductase